ncbi:hypothetical protein [Symmachiella dynata]|uniref:hypothetical protein n=1 Tax=Symmachiella dynata TaxID=2527995 RepID=UPI0011A708E6|nr:hypothetical protein [Symmachiella dynata]
MVSQFKYSFKDGGDLSVILWTDVRSGGGVSTSGVEQDGQTFVQQGYVYWDEDEKMRCSFAVRMRSNGQHTVEIVGSEYDLSDGATILVKNRGGKVTAEVKQIAGYDLDNAHNVAHENQEIVDFYSDNQHPEGEQNETPKE